MKMGGGENIEGDDVELLITADVERNEVGETAAAAASSFNRVLQEVSTDNLNFFCGGSNKLRSSSLLLPVNSLPSLLTIDVDWMQDGDRVVKVLSLTSSSGPPMAERSSKSDVRNLSRP